MQKKWILPENNPEKINEFSKKYAIDPIIAEIILSRQYNLQKDIDLFLNPDISGLQTPFLMKDMNVAVDRIKKAVMSSEKVGIFSDSDLDGLTSLSVIHKLLNALNIEVFYDFPKDGEKYGLNIRSIDNFKENDVSLIITLDCGIRDFEEIDYAVEKSIDVIVCDHHETDKELPSAICIDPKRIDCNYPCKNLAGVGVALKLSHAVLISYLPMYNKQIYFINNENSNYNALAVTNGVVTKYNENIKLNDLLQVENINNDLKICLGESFNLLKERNIKNIYSLGDLIPSKEILDKVKNIISFYQKGIFNSEIFLKRISNLTLLSFSDKMYKFINSVLPFVAIGTIADVVPLLGENRIIVKYGLELFEKSKNPAIAKLRSHCYNDCTSKSIAWTAAPLLNTPGRYGLTSLTADFFLQDSAEIEQLYPKIKQLNLERKNLIAGLMEKINSNIRNYDKGNYIYFCRNDLHDGITGILAGRISDKYGKPCIALNLSNEDNQISKGSGRSPETVNLFSKIEPFSNIFDRFGGHAQAFGFSISNSNVNEFQDIISTQLSNVVVDTPSIKADTNIIFENIEEAVIDKLDILEPFGHLNREPIFISKNIEFNSYSSFGKKGEHLKLFTKNDSVEIICWGKASCADYFMNGNEFDIIYNLSKSKFGGRTVLRAVLQDYRISEDAVQ